MKSLSLLIGLMLISSSAFAQQKVVMSDSEIKKEIRMDYLKACNKEFHTGIYRNTVWIQGMQPFQFCQQYASHMTKDL